MTGDPPVKPRDAGNGLVCASFSTDAAAWLSLGAPHPEHGYVELTGLPAFDEEWRGRADAVRRYRGWMAEPRFAFLRIDNAREYDEEIRPVANEPEIEWRCRVTRRDDPDAPVTVRVRGRLQRHAYAEITEVSPLPPMSVATRTRVVGDRLVLDAPRLPARADIAVRVDERPASGWVTAAEEASLTLPETRGHVVVTVRCSLRRGCAFRVSTVEVPRVLPARRTPSDHRLRVPVGLTRELRRIADGSLRYVLGCTALRVAEDEVCLVTDHRLLPLSWTRDAYWQAALLLAGDTRDRPGRRVVADHLRWLWRRSRPTGSWMRSHLTDGQVKDRVLQADQQLYPLLELCDYREASGTWPDPPRGRGEQPAAFWRTAVADVWTDLASITEDHLLVGAESPADDPSGLPATLSTQILCWHAARRLSRWAGELGLDARELDDTAEAVRGAVARHALVPGPFGDQWAYELDGSGGHRRYQDANDLPTALAPLWGFCPPTDPAWVATMRFAFSEHNPAYLTGAFGGLGSAHSPGTWPLGDVQRWVAASLAGDAPGADAALARLCRVAAPDGLLPETYDQATGTWVSRPWFAWPGAALGALVLRHGDLAQG